MDRIRKALDLARELPARSVDSAAEQSRPVLLRVAKLRALEVGDEAATQVQSILEQAASADSIAELPRPTLSSQGKQKALGTSKDKLRSAVAVIEPTVEVETLQSPSSLDSTVEPPPPESTAAPILPTAIQYTKTKTFSPSATWLESNRIVNVSGSDAVAAAFRILRTQVLQKMLKHDWRSIAILSPGSDDGKTTTAINLAISLANDQRHTVLLVEFDLKEPIIAKRLGISAEMGADDLLRGSVNLEDCLYHPEGFERFVVMPARARMQHSSEMLAGPRCRGIVAELRARYPDRLLVFDLPPVLGADDAVAFLPLVDCALIVVAEGETPRADLLRCMELVRNTPVVGTVLNFSADAESAYGSR
jgi:Mrp family chromosome partitioning ATPase